MFYLVFFYPADNTCFVKGVIDLRFAVAYIYAVCILIGCLGCGKKQERCTETILAMGGVPVEIVFFSRGETLRAGDLDAVIEEVGRLEKIMSRHMEFSTVSRLNRRSPGSGMDVGPELAEVLTCAQKVYRETDGAFDPTVTPLITLWKEARTIPSQQEVERARAQVGFEHISIQGDIVTRNKDVILDLGGIAKGFIADSIAELLRKRGVKAGLVNAGGDIRVFGRRRGGFIIGIRDPDKRKGEIKRTRIYSGAAVTSGSYERFRIIDGKRISHIIDPKTGNPVAGSLKSVTVCARDAATADAIATGIFVMGFERGKKLLKRLEDVSGVLITADGTVWPEDVPDRNSMYATGGVTAVFIIIAALWYVRYYRR